VTSRHPPCQRCDLAERPEAPASGTDLVLVADAFYQRDLAGKVMRFAERSQACGADVLVGDFDRPYLPRGRLTPLANYDVPGQCMLEGSDIKHTTVWALTGQRPEP
jgi:predicted nicotinamide N-methyase